MVRASEGVVATKTFPPTHEKKVAPTAPHASPVVVQNITNTIQHIQVNTLGHHQHITVSPTSQTGGPTTVAAGSAGVGNASAAILHNFTPARPSGWPEKWPVPQVIPTAFKPLGFEISQPELEAAVGSLSREERASCARGDTQGVARLMVEILKRVHSDPRERNVYLNPSRSDQALVYVPTNWTAQPLEEAAQSMFERIKELLADAQKAPEKGVNSAVEGARKGCEEKLPQLARASRGQLTAHLENVRRATASGEDWLGTGGVPADQPAFAGKEFAGHLNGAMLAPALEQASAIYSPSDVEERTAAAKASRALAECSRYILHSRPKNLTVVEVGGVLYAHERVAGWVPWPRDRAASALLGRAASALDNHLHDAPDSPLVLLRPWLRERLPEVLLSSFGQEAGERVLRHYSTAASRYYSALPRVQDPHDRKEAARRLLAGEPPLRCDSLAAAAKHEGTEEGCPPPALALEDGAGRLTDADIEGLLGW